jgi:hypothetical protein
MKEKTPDECTHCPTLVRVIASAMHRKGIGSIGRHFCAALGYAADALTSGRDGAILLQFP